MNDSAYHQRVLVQHALREYTEFRQRAEKTATNDTSSLIYQQYDDNLLSYPIFYNGACKQHATAKTLQDKALQDDYCRRWLYFHTPDVAQLPHIPYAAQLMEEAQKLGQQLRTQQAPRLALFSLVFVLVIFLSARGHFGLTLLPITLLTAFWLYTDKGIQKKQLEMQRHKQALLDLREQYWQLQDQLASLPTVVEYTHFTHCYKLAVKRLLRQALGSLLHPQELSNIRENLNKRQWRLFGLESWGVLQLPLQQDTELHQWFFTNENHMISALQPVTSTQPHTLYRLTYLQLWVLTEHGVLMSSGFYERVADQILHLQQEFIPYTQIAAFEIAETLLPEHEPLKTSLPETIHQHYFQQPITVLSLQTKRGICWQCAALPKSHTQTHSESGVLADFGIATDLTALERLLHERLYMQQAV